MSNKSSKSIQYYLTKAQEIGKIGTWELDINKGNIIWTKESYKIFGIPEGTKINSELFFACVHPDDLHLVSEKWKVAIDKGHYDIEHRLLIDNKIKWIKEKADIEFDKEGNPVSAIGFTQDITKDKNIELDLIASKNKIKESEEKYKALYENTPLSYQSLDQDGKFIDINPAWCKTLGFSRDEVIGKWFGDFLHPDYVENFKIKFPKFKERGNVSNVQYRVKHKNGDFLYISFEGCIGNNPDGSFKQTYCTFKDITSQKNAEIELKKSEDRFSQIIENSKDLIWEVDKNGLYTYVSDVVENILSYKPEEIIGKKHFYDFFEHNTKNQLKKIALDAFEQKKSFYDFENLCTAKNGNLVWLSTSGSPILDEDGKLTGYRGLDKDITKQKNHTSELLIAKQKAEESDRLKTEFINNMSHEVRTPMNGILGFSEMLNSQGITNEKRETFIKIIQSSSHQLLQVIDDILEISSLGTKQVKVFESEVCLNDVLVELFSIFDTKAKENKTPLYLKKEFKDSQSIIFTDKLKLNKIISNLLENALKFTNQGCIEFGYHLKNNNIELFVKDTGIGIEKSKHELIFERFSQAENGLSKNTGGLGLGLSIAKENTILLGGTINLESKVGLGSTFFVTIPYNPVHVNDDTENTPKYTILIAEDEEVNYLYLETMLEDVINLDCKIIHVKNGQEAIEISNENKNIDLVLMDLKMPVMNGFEATKQIKQLYTKLPVIALTAYSTEKERKQSFLSGCDDFISKPVSLDTIKKMLDRHLLIKQLN